MDRKKIQMLSLFLVVAAILVVLPAGISRIKIQQEELPIQFDFTPTTQLAKRIQKPAKVSRLMTIASATIVIAAVLFFLLTGGFRQLIGFAIIVGIFVIARILLRGAGGSSDVAENQIPTLNLQPKTPKLPKPPLEEPQTWITWGVTLAVCVVILLTAFFIWRWLKRKLTPMEEVAAEAKKSIERIKEGVDLREVVIRCYHDMTDILSKSHELSRSTAMTPREFEIYLHRSGFLTDDVRRISRLFERVRYGGKKLGKEAEAEAIQSLEAFVTFCDGKHD